MAVLLGAVSRGPACPYEPPPAFALYAAAGIAVLRGSGVSGGHLWGLEGTYGVLGGTYGVLEGTKSEAKRS